MQKNPTSQYARRINKVIDYISQGTAVGSLAGEAGTEPSTGAD
jgi:hypothetical protein